jgi:GIY-YIG catalytic domain-containing protein
VSAEAQPFADQALDALKAGRAVRIAHAAEHVPAIPGLYAIHGGSAVWRELRLGAPPDVRPLYLGKAEESLVSRDLETHFGDGRTGSSTVRRSFASLLHDALDLRGIPRNPAMPGYFANYGLSPEHDAALTAWMRRRLRLAIWAKPEGCDAELASIERSLLARLEPPLNLQHVTTPWTAQVKAARRAMAGEARTGAGIEGGR